MIKQILRTLLLLLVSVAAVAKEPHSHTAPSSVQYMANEGLMVVQGETKVVFDPLFRNAYGQYQLLPKAMEAALFAGEPPFDGVDAIFVSHYHGDHFSPDDILRLLKEQPGIYLYAPTQAVTGLRSVADTRDEAVFDRVIAVELAYKDAPVTMEMEGLNIEAVRIPHSGWPDGRLDVENISWRVTLNKTTTVLHLGDADADDVHFARDAAYWDKRHTHMAFPPYWFFASNGGRDVLENRIKPGHSVGVHVPVTMPTNQSQRPPQYRAYDLFTEPGEKRDIPASKPLELKEPAEQ
jgi:L-ascorbate metabolism protein UlaG (beta-lactamase superfamily)